MVFEKTTHFELKLDFIAFSLSIFITSLTIFKFDCVRKKKFTPSRNTRLFDFKVKMK